MSLLDDIYGDDSRTIVEIANDIATPNRVVPSRVQLRMPDAFEKVALFLEKDCSSDIEAIFKEKIIIQ